MNITETTQALALAQAFDNRTVGEVNIRAWFSVLSDADAADVMAAIRDHYAGTTEWIMPAHIRAAVSVMVQRRAAAARATGWAPGQHGVPVADAMPEVSGPIDESVITPSVRALLDATRAMLPEGSREALMPRKVAWEREHTAFVRVRDGEPNPRYRPGGVVPEVDRARQFCRDNGPHDAGYHIDTCPDGVDE